MTLVEKISVYEGSDVEDDENDHMMNFDERDLLRHAEAACCREVRRVLIDAEPGSWVEDWARLLGTAPNPNA